MSDNKSRRLGRRESRDLDVEIGFLEGLVRRDPSYIEALQLLGDDYTRRGRIEDGLKVDRQLQTLRPHDPEVLFNLACSLALSGNHPGAIQELMNAIEAGYRDFRWLSRDPDLAKLRKDPAYRTVRAKIKSLKSTVA